MCKPLAAMARSWQGCSHDVQIVFNVPASLAVLRCRLHGCIVWCRGG
ncbi:hypothetical protein ATPR_1587 [Acetobacter tropicalis NBRC 101654]|uniref:Uncharacterized protein n=1 Tax=Acetobacter tropicalis NBRC 101654 TaxID=749388 RepID=F7VDY8_9PROT|nr:hypothetical protein ATPR_1587 [Acetobacter tropicalis NBRC 101654]